MAIKSAFSTNRPKDLCVLGATGSIGDSVTDIVLDNPNLFRVKTVVAGTNAQKLAERAIKVGAQRAIIAESSAYNCLSSELEGSGIEVASGEDAIIEACEQPVDIVVSAMVGSAGMRPTMAAIEAGNTVALANKEALVCAGELMISRARQNGTTLLPVDSEHNALFQVFEVANRNALEKVTLTASGGPFRTWSENRIKGALLKDALKHPNWSMGQKVTIDSASLANKGLEVIEASHLFGLTAAQIDVVVHPQSIIHGLVHYCDGSVLAQLGMPDMRTPIAAALAWPSRCAAPQVEKLNLAQLGELTFEAPDLKRFPMLRLAYDALNAGGLYPALYNAADEVAVEAFVAGDIAFHEIAKFVELSFERAGASEGALFGKSPSHLDDVLAADALGKRIANSVMSNVLQST